ncbi:MAG: UDP-N-acetylmuramoyl-L-alanine--D-glutamate ligase, partial [Bacillota bacterium]|nr:UDP-N-acetylmuramoyl-L-alanine--D-glutamate ligase [Bacillota bacterium]
ENVVWLKDHAIKCYFAQDPTEEFDKVVISPGIKPDNQVAKLGKELIGELELAYEMCKGSFIAITGTNGKTTTTTLAGEFAKSDGLESFTVGNIGDPVTGIADQTTDNSILVTEVSSYQLETIKRFRPHISAIINLSPDHLDRHGDAEEYYRCKERIFENQTEDDILVYNGDDEQTVKSVAKATKPIKVMFTKKKTEVELNGIANVAFVKDGDIIVRKDNKEQKIIKIEDLQVIGGHNIDDILCASAIAIFAGIKQGSIAKVLRGFRGVEHRLELVRELKGVKYINDSKGTNPDASIRAIEAINQPIILIAGGYEKNLDFTSFANAFGDKVRYLILLGATAGRIEKAALNAGFKDEDIIKCSSLDACVAAATRLAESGDCVLLSPACASWDMYKNFEERGDDFKKSVKNLK